MNFKSGHGISIGSETSGNVTNVIFRNLTLDGTETGVRIKSCMGRGGMVSNITYQNMTITNVGVAISIDQFYDSNSCSNGNEYPPIFKNFNVLNIYGEVKNEAGDFKCLSEMPCHHIMFNNVNIHKSESGFHCENAYGTAVNVYPESCLKSEN